MKKQTSRKHNSPKRELQITRQIKEIREKSLRAAIDELNIPPERAARYADAFAEANRLGFNTKIVKR